MTTVLLHTWQQQVSLERSGHTNSRLDPLAWCMVQIWAQLEQPVAAAASRARRLAKVVHPSTNLTTKNTERDLDGGCPSWLQFVCRAALLCV